MQYGNHYPAEGKIIDATLLRAGYVVGEMKEVQFLPPGKGKLVFKSFAKDSASELSGPYEIQVITEDGDITVYQNLRGVSVSHRADRAGRYAFSYTFRQAFNSFDVPSGKRTKRQTTPWEPID